MSLEAIKFDPQNNTLEIIDQLKLPLETTYISIQDAQDGFHAIKKMNVRGAPAIAIVGALATSIDIHKFYLEHPEVSLADLKKYALEKLKFIVTARPTAVNLSGACEKLQEEVSKAESPKELVYDLLSSAGDMLDADIQDNKAIGSFGAYWALQTFEGQPISVVTICNTGSLATAGYGTALGIIRSLHKEQLLRQVYALETRPYNQGARLTAYELVHDNLPATLITDSMAASLMGRFPDVKLAVVGADRVALNGDTANKIGTYQLAVLAKQHDVKFVVAAPTTSIDFETASGDDIVIEERPADELTSISGVRIAAPGINVWNPAFDVTPFELIDAIVTEKGVVEKTDGVFDLTVLANS